jgi:hypothetical protein
MKSMLLLLAVIAATIDAATVDANGAMMASASDWVLGAVAAGGRGHLHVPVPAHAPADRASVQSL